MLGLVLGQHENQAMGAEGGDTDGEGGRLLAEALSHHLDLALADLAVAAHPPGHGEQFGRHQVTSAHQAVRAGGGAGPQHVVLGVEHDGGGGQYGQD
jgi:hypothetical protein